MFSTNATVTASSMQISASTGSNLYIAKGANVALASLTATSVSDLAVTNSDINPAEMTNAAGTVTVKYPTAYSSAPTVSTAGTGSTWQTVGTLTQTTATDNADPALDLDEYCAYAYVTIARKQTSAASYDLTATCSVTFSQASALNGALRAGIIINSNWYESNDANATTGTSATFTFSEIESLSDNTAYSACLVFWFEGEDTDCTANNAVDISTNTASWSFTSKEHD